MGEGRAGAGARSRALKVGLMLPSGEQMLGGGSARWEDLLGMATRAEDLGFDSLWLVDHVLYEFGDTRDIGMWECWSLLSALAAVTTHVDLGSLVTSTAYRSPAMLASIVNTVDEVSGGRVILGVGAGWVRSEFDALGIPYGQRIDRFEEAIEIITRLLREREIDFAGRHYAARESKLRPPGVRAQGPPIMIGSVAHGPRMLGLAARYADIWNIGFRTSPGTLPDAIAAMEDACRAIGRDPATLGRSASLQVNMPGHGKPGDYWIADTRVGSTLTGTPEELAATLREYAALGIEHVQVWLDPNTIEGMEAFAPVLALLEDG